ncbi:MAG: N-acetylmuramoyl-L-alanine amidase [Candidatus Eisenbacteria bacterium]|nr:N-acetylmuramoyl-L-alanine amidase [Candidatus Eisenbacteria bacterium]
MVKTVASAFLIFVTVILLFSGCALLPKGPTGRPYERLAESIKGLDTSALKGRKIVIDPGHGGRYFGARGVKGIKESDVNLGVALYLWGLLKDSGADVILTRSSDKDFVGDKEAILKNDLSLRSKIANDFSPDIFLSIHHNSDVGKKTNESQVYYRLLDSGPSLDLAKCIAKHLSANLGIGEARVMPGNYFVLRNSSSPAVLGEPSYLTNPLVEKRLVLSEKQKMEAEAYFLGLVEYFSKGVPCFFSDVDRGTVFTTPLPEIAIGLRAGAEEADPDWSTLSVKIDGRETECRIDRETWRISVRPKEALPNGNRELQASIRNMNGNSSKPFRQRFKVGCEPAKIVLSSTPPVACEKTGAALCLKAYVQDMYGRPVADSTVVLFSYRGAASFRNQSRTVGGEAFSYSSNSGGAVSAQAQTGTVRDSITCSTAGGDTCWLTGFIKDSRSGLPIRSARVEIAGQTYTETNRDGFFAAICFSKGDSVTRIFKEGYEQSIRTASGAGDSGVQVSVNPLFDGIFQGKRIVIDPESLEPDEGNPKILALSPRLNLEVSRRLAALITDAGGQAFLTRDEHTSPSAAERVMFAETAGADFFIQISHSGIGISKTGSFYYPGSAAGRMLASSVAGAFSDSLGRKIGVFEYPGYTIQQTSAPAVIIRFFNVSGAADRVFLDKKKNLELEAFLIFSGLKLTLQKTGANP